MKVIDAFWEKKNLGTSTQEVIVSKDDDIDVFTKAINSLSADYQVLKIPIENHKLIAECQNFGFKFIEAMCYLSFNIDKDIVLSPHISYRKATLKDMELIYSNINDQMFTTDRIYIDPFFAKETAPRRYINWIKDEMEKNALVLTVLLDNNPIGFSCLSFRENEYCEFLYGIFKNYQGRGFAKSIVDCGAHYVRSQGWRLFNTSISTDNIKSLRSHLSYGFKIEALRYVFVKHL